MKKIFVLFPLLTVLLLVSSFVQQPTCDVTVVISGLRSNKGQLMVSLNQGTIDFPDSNYFLHNFLHNLLILDKHHLVLL